MKMIFEETEVKYSSLDELSYIDCGDESPSREPMVKLYVNNKYEGHIERWCDYENDERDYICVNYEMIYLDTIKECNQRL